MSEVHLLRSSHAKPHLRDELEAQGHQITDLTGESASDSAQRLRDAVAAGDVERVVLAGGDGLINLAIQELAETDVAVGIVPSGTGNDFAKALGIASGSEQALSATSPVDLIRVDYSQGASWVASIAIAGFPATINERANQLPARLGSAVYAIAALLELPNFHRTEVALTVAGEPLRSDTAMLAIGNTRFFGGGMLACPDARHDDGLLHLTSIEAVGRLGIVRHLNARTGGSADRPEVIRRTARAITIDTPGISLWGDGEPIGTSPLSLTIQPNALRVASVNGASSDTRH